MRWLVEVTSLGKTDTESLHIESDSWQKALQLVRAQRGESSPMSGFSIELLDDGCRARDPTSRLRYAVRRAADEATGRPSAASGAPPALLPPRPSSFPAPNRQAPVVGKAPSADFVPPVASAADPASGEGYEVFFKREQDPTDTMPLTYREYAFLVQPRTSEAAAEALLQAQLVRVRSLLERSSPGKLVNLGVFDGVVQGRPTLPPLATLTWKDWRATPVVVFPRRDRRPLVTGTVREDPPLESASMSDTVAFPVSMKPVMAVSLEAEPAPVASTAAEFPAIRALAADAPSHAAVEPIPAPSVAPRERPTVSVAATIGAAPRPETSVPEVSPTVSAGAADHGSLPPPVAVPVNVVPASTVAPSQSPPPPARARVRGEELIADLFEAMHELHFLRDAVEGGYFCLNLAMEKLPSRAGIVHLYDIDRRTFLVTAARGPGARSLLLRRHPEGDPILSAAMRKRSALVMTDPLRGDKSLPDRYAEVGGVRSLLIAPVMQSGRFLGAIEVIDPLDGQPFTEAEGNALTYIAEQFAEFVATRGVVTDPERISVIR